jgi:ectoine hydroxylase-related dioxygenase (phytanoyl-CoA dioxygenase family)
MTAPAIELPQATRDVARLTADMDAVGYCLVAPPLPAATIEAIRERVEEQAEAERRLGHRRLTQVQDPGGANQWVHMLLNKGAVFRALLDAPEVEAVVEHVLGPGYTLSSIDAHGLPPGNTPLPLHTDQWWMPLPRPPGEPHMRAGSLDRGNVAVGPPARATGPINPPLVVNAMWMITDFTEENGGTRLVPGSHLSGAQPDPAVPHRVPTVAATGPAGTVVIWEGRMWHAGGVNRGNVRRWGIPVYYGAPQIRSLANLTLGTRPEVLADASPKLRRLLGFEVWNEYGGTGSLDGYAHPASELIGELRP